MWQQFLVQGVFSYLATIGFGICSNVPRRALHVCGLTGLTGWLIYWSLLQLEIGKMLPNLAGAFALALLSWVIARRHKIPVIIVNIPGLVPLVPGGVAYRAVRAFALGNYQLGIQFTVQVLMIAGAIAVGFMLAQLVTSPGQLRRQK